MGPRDAISLAVDEPALEPAQIAARQVEDAQTSAEARLRLAADFYGVGAGHCRCYGRAELSFLRWEIGRGVLNARQAAKPGSRWWRALNDTLLRDKAEARIVYDAAHAHAHARSGHPSSRRVELWLEFIAQPSPVAWYRAHNASVLAGYIEHESLALEELPVERFMMNVALLRVLFTHFLAAQPRLAMGPLAPLARFLVDPRGGSVQFFVDLRSAFPNRYPLTGLSVSDLVAAEGSFSRALDYGIIVPRLAQLYPFAAAALEQPRIMDLISDGIPCYADPAQPSLWHNEFSARLLPRLAAFVTGAGRSAELEPSQVSLSRR